MNPTLVFYAFAVWVLASSGVRGWRRMKAARKAPKRVPLRDAYLLGPILSAFGGLCSSVAIWLTAPMFLNGTAVTAARLLAVAAALSTGIETALAYRWALTGAPRRTITFAIHAATCAVGVMLLLITQGLRGIPRPSSQALALEFPVHGRWRVVSGGRNALTNHHHGQPPSQDYAIDMVLDGPKNASEGQTVYAPADGTVIKAEGSHAGGEGPAEGNIIVIRTSDGTEIWLAHLQTGSLKVATGDPIKRATAIAAVGSTGSADFPHLHIHAQRDFQPMPMVFGPKKQWLVRGDFLEGTGR